MRTAATTAILSAAIAGFGLFSAPWARGQAQPQPPAAAPGAGPNAAAPNAVADKAAANLPVRQVVLYSSGVGYFEHFGSVNGNGSTELRFKTQQINDVLKSLILQDLDKGKVGVITYPSQDPVAKTLRSFQVDITSNPSVAQLLGQLRGARVTVTAGGQPVTGTVLGVEKKPRAVGDDKDGKNGRVVDVWFVNLITDGGIRSVSLEDVATLELLDPKLRDELNRALAALAAARDTDTKPVTINFAGAGERRLRVGYVVETPVWKTSYRLQISSPADAPAKAAAAAPIDPAADALRKRIADAEAAVKSLKEQLGENHPSVKARQRELEALAAQAKPGEGDKANTGQLQGWAIVENQTDNDWTDVQLSLVSGRPISFIQDLYQPLYIPRPVVQPELYASLRPQTYDAGLSAGKKMEKFGAEAGERDEQRDNLRRNAPAAKARQAAGGQGGGGSLFSSADKAQDAPAEAMDLADSVSSVASAAKLGELFQYTVGNVSLPRQTSAMIPVVTDPVEVEKLSIYNLNVLPGNPLLGARVKNTTGKHLLQGPITVLADGKYAGDARIDDVPPGQERLISYGIDQQVIVQAKNGESRSSFVAAKIVKGVLELTQKEVVSQEYVAENKGDADKTLLIEHARMGGDWKLTAPAKADETTDSLYRFKGKVQAGKGTQLQVVQELVHLRQIAILPMDPNSILTYARVGDGIPKEVSDALTKAAALKQTLAETQRQIQERTNRIAQVTEQQNRLRENLRTVAQNTDYYNRLLAKLNDQETEIEGYQKEVSTLRQTAETQRKAMEDYLNGLTVGG